MADTDPIATTLAALEDVRPEEKGRLGRSRFLQVLGAGFFGLTARMVLRSDPALAAHRSVPPCGPSGRCHCCNGSNCCAPGCTVRRCDCDGNCAHNAWVVCHSGHQHRCSDYFGGNGRRCICRSTYERACGGRPTAVGTGQDVFLSWVGVSGVTPGGVFVNSPISADVIPVAVTDLIVSAEVLAEGQENVVDGTGPDPHGILQTIRDKLIKDPCLRPPYCEP